VLLLQLSNGQTATSPSRSDLESGAHSQTGQYETRKDLSAEAVEEGEIDFAAKNECAISRVGAVCSRLIFQNRHRPSNRTLLSATESNTRIKTGLLRIRSLCRPRSSTQSPPLESLNRSSSLPMDIEVRGYSSESRCSRGMKKSPQSCKTKSVNSSVLTERPPL
jgi:hypothetical protein